MKRIYRPMSILVTREQENENCGKLPDYGTVKGQAGAEVSRFEVSSLEGFFFRSQQSTRKIVYRCKFTWRGYNGKYETRARKRSIALGNFDKRFLSFSVLRHAATGKFSGEQ